MMRHFICGCDSEDPYVRNYHPKLVWQNGQQVLSFKHYDKQGNEICPIHGKPLKGSLTVHRLKPPAGYVPKKITGELGSLRVDKRDNRDPAEVYAEAHPHEHTITTSALPLHGNGAGRIVFGSEADIS
jgi:hypothetical protein